MKMFTAGAAALLSVLGTAAFASATLKGEYIEARTCNVYIGACHANGERVTTGREAIMAWNIKEGMIDNLKMNGLKVVAVVVAKDNLAECENGGCGSRKTVLFVDSKATEAQREALAWALGDKYAKTLGTIVKVKAAPISFNKKGEEYSIRVPDVAELKATSLKKSCCVMPHEVWYQPLIDVKNSFIGTCAVNEFKGTPEMATKWRHTDENSTYVGDFSF